MVGSILSAVIVVSLVSIGLAAIVAPRRASAQYGIVVEDPRALAFVRAMGARDVVIGGLLGMAAVEQARLTLACGMGLAALIALTDLVVVRADRQAASTHANTPVMLHAGGVLGFLATTAVLLAGY